MNIVSLWVPVGSSLDLLYGHKEWWSVYSGFVLDEKNTRFSVVAVYIHECITRNTSVFTTTSILLAAY